jgi:hypothetical protein
LEIGDLGYRKRNTEFMTEDFELRFKFGEELYIRAFLM